MRAAATSGGGGGGAFPIRGDVTWSLSTDGPHGLAFATDPNGHYYNVLIPGGETLAFPQTVGHYSFRLGPGAQVQTTVAP